MTGPLQGRYSLRCSSCQATVYLSDTEPPADQRALLTAFADEQCPRGGVGCPNATEARERDEERRPERLMQIIRAARDRLPRSRSLVLPALAANTPVEVEVTWPAPLPAANYQVGISQEIDAPSLLGAIAAAVKAGSRTTRGCTLHVAASRDIPAGRAGLHLVAIP